jgi:hypothetical protein
MFCPKCGVENSEKVKFCRKCGCDLNLVSEALSGKLTDSDHQKNKKNKKQPTWEAAIFFIAISLAFFIVSIILAFQPMGAGWWFWLLFAGFTMLALGIAQVIPLIQDRKDGIKISSDKVISLPESENKNALPPGQTEFVTNIPNFENETADLRPPSVVEGTTRNLEMDSEGETISLPKKG